MAWPRNFTVGRIKRNALTQLQRFTHLTVLRAYFFAAGQQVAASLLAHGGNLHPAYPRPTQNTRYTRKEGRRVIQHGYFSARSNILLGCPKDFTVTPPEEFLSRPPEESGA